MRNCFVPGCDAFCKKLNTSQRKMFLPPPKMHSSWTEVLPKKRIFKTSDRICERHFDENDIITHWESTINGQIHLTPRDKPKLRECAIPCRNLPSKNECSPQKPEEQLKKRNQKIDILSQKIIAPSKWKSIEDFPPPKKITRNNRSKLPSPRASPIAIISTPVLEVNDFDINTNDSRIEPVKPALSGKSSNECEIEIQLTPEQQEKMKAAFNDLYEEAFDVTLPSLLWGIHRCPDRKFIAFSEFNPNTMSCSKILHISDTFHCKTYVNSELSSVRILEITHLATDYVSVMLDELEGVSIAR